MINNAQGRHPFLYYRVERKRDREILTLIRNPLLITAKELTPEAEPAAADSTPAEEAAAESTPAESAEKPAES